MVNTSDRYIVKHNGISYYSNEKGVVLGATYELNPDYDRDNSNTDCDCDYRCSKKGNCYYNKTAAITLGFGAIVMGIYWLIDYLTYRNKENNQGNSTITTTGFNLTSDPISINPFNATTTNIVEIGSMILNSVRQVYQNVTNNPGN
jgi:hypothetical protein